MRLIVAMTCWIKSYLKKFFLIGLTIVSSFLFTACASTHVDRLDINSMEGLIAVKNTPNFKSCQKDLGGMYNTTDNYFISPRCIFKNNIPETFTFEYAIYSVEERSKDIYAKQTFKGDEGYFTLEGEEVNRETWQALAKQNELKAIAQLPESAWHTYTINIEDALDRYKGKMPTGTPEGIVIPVGLGIRFPSVLPWLQDRNLSFDVLIDENGNVEVEENYSWEHVLSPNPYA